MQPNLCRRICYLDAETQSRKERNATHKTAFFSAGCASELCRLRVDFAPEGRTAGRFAAGEVDATPCASDQMKGPSPTRSPE